jgi:hypothetical protein
MSLLPLSTVVEWLRLRNEPYLTKASRLQDIANS